MKKTSRILATVLTLAMAAASLAACGGSSSAPATTAAPAATEAAATEAAATEAAAETEAPAAEAPAGEVVTLRFAGASPESSPAYAESERFIERCKEESGGTLNIEFYPYNQLGDAAQVYEEVIMGTIDMGLLNPQETITPLAAIGKIPGTAFSSEEFEKVFGPGSYCDEVTNKALADVGITCFGTSFGGITGIATNKEAADPADPSVPKGVLVRSPASTAYTSAIKAIGFDATPMAYSEIYTSMQTGIVNGYGGGMPHTVIASFSDLVKYYYDYNIVPESLCTMINTGVYNKLTAEQQEIIARNFKLLVQESYVDFLTYEEDCKDQLREMGIEVIEFSEEERDAMAAAVRETSWTELESVFGKEFFDGLKESMGL